MVLVAEPVEEYGIEMFIDPRIAATARRDAFVMPTSFLPDPIICESDLPPETREETVRLAVDSARRWARRTDLSPETRVRRMWTVLTTALEETK